MNEEKAISHQLSAISNNEKDIDYRKMPYDF